MSDLPDQIADALVAYLIAKSPALDKRQARLDLAAIVPRAKAHEQFLLRNGRKQPTTLRYLAEALAAIYNAHTDETLGRTTNRGTGANMLLKLADAAGFVDLTTRTPYTLQQASDAIKETRDKMNKRLGLPKLGRFAPKPAGDMAGRKAFDAAIGAFERDEAAGKSNDDVNEQILTERADESRDNARKEYLSGHVVGYADDDGNILKKSEVVFERTGEILEGEDGTKFAVVEGPEPIIEGYEPARDPERLASASISKDALEKLLKETKK